MGNSFSSIGRGKCKGPEAVHCLWCLKNNEEISGLSKVGGGKGEGRVVGGEVREG